MIHRHRVISVASFVWNYLIIPGMYLLSFMLLFVILRGLSDGNDDPGIYTNIALVLVMGTVPLAILKRCMYLFFQIKRKYAINTVVIVSTILLMLIFGEYLPSDSYESRHRFDPIESDEMRQYYGQFSYNESGSTIKSVLIRPDFVNVTGLDFNGQIYDGEEAKEITLYCTKHQDDNHRFECASAYSCNIVLLFDIVNQILEVEDQCDFWGKDIYLGGSYIKVQNANQ